jgi:hypothetical protein
MTVPARHSVIEDIDNDAKNDERWEDVFHQQKIRVWRFRLEDLLVCQNKLADSDDISKILASACEPPIAKHKNNNGNN